MRSRRAAWLLLLTAATAACGMAFTPSDTALFTPAPESVLRAWKSTSYQQVLGTPCPWIIEFFEDGSAETNYLNDDRGKLCMFARVPFEHLPDEDPPQLHISGQISHCLYRIRDERLQLACDDHSVPSAAKAKWIEFAPLKVKRGHRLADLEGTWLPPLFFGGRDRMVIGKRGELDVGGDQGKVEIVGKDRLLLKGRGHDERCLFRVTANRLTLRCRPVSDDWPEGVYPLRRGFQRDQASREVDDR